MKRLAILNHPRLAQAFIDYMSLQHVKCVVRKENDNDLVIYVVDPEQFAQAEEELDRFVADPNNPRYREASWQRPDDSGARFHYYRTGHSLWQTFRENAGPLTWIVFGACVLFYVLSLVGFSRPLYALFHFPIIDLGQRYQLWRLITPALLHFTLIHIFFNIFWWWYLAGRVERHESSATLLSVTLASAIVGNVAQGWLYGPDFIGLSGVVYGLVAYCAVRARSIPELYLPPGYIGIMVLWLFAGFAGWLGQPTANFAHLGGLLAGAVCGLVSELKAARR